MQNLGLCGLVLGVTLAGCSAQEDVATRDVPNAAGPETTSDSISVLAVKLNAQGNVITHSDTVTAAEFRAMVAAREARQAAAKEKRKLSDVEVAQQALVVRDVGCGGPADDSLWLYDGSGQLLCIARGTAYYDTFDLNSVGWQGRVRTIWPGTFDGYIAFGVSNCHYAGVCAAWEAWGPRFDASECLDTFFDTVVTPMSWVNPC